MLTLILLAIASYTAGRCMTKPVYRHQIIRVNRCNIHKVQPKPLVIPYYTRPDVELTTYTHPVFKNC